MRKKTFTLLMAAILGLSSGFGQENTLVEQPDPGTPPSNSQDLAEVPAPAGVPSLEEAIEEAKRKAEVAQSSNTGDTVPGLNVGQAIENEKESEGDEVPTATQAAKGNEGAGVIEETEGGYWLKDAPLNEVFQYLAQRASMQYFYNTSLSGPEFLVTGQLLDATDPVTQMEELGLMYEITIHQKGNTVYALVPAQLTVLPNKPTSYQLRYLRPSDIDKIKAILMPFLTPGTGSVEYEEKTNTIIVFDNNERKVRELMDMLSKIDQPKQQVAIETRIMRVKSSSRNRIGVDWGSVLGEGTPIEASVSLNNLFNLPNLDTIDKVLTLGTGETGTRNRSYSGSNLILSPPQIQAVVRALNSGGLVQQESSPTLITEDNEEGVISIVDRVPIIISTVSATTVGQNITEVVRYKIDQADPVGDPSTSREIGVSVAVTPTILPDGTIRMKLRPRSSQIVEFVEARSGNSFPRVNESSVTTMARVPNSYSLLIGGFYEETEADNSRKVPIFGDIPGANFLFKSDDKSKENTSLVFIVTPTLYDPARIYENNKMSQNIQDLHVLPTNHDSPDDERPGFNYRASMKNTFAGIFKKRRPTPRSSPLVPRQEQQYEPRDPAPYYGSQESSQTYKYPDSVPTQPAPTQVAAAPSAQATPVSQTKGSGGFFKNLFGNKKTP